MGPSYGFANSMHKAYVIQHATQSHHKDTITDTVAMVGQPEQQPKEPTSSDYIFGGFGVLFIAFLVVCLIKG